MDQWDVGPTAAVNAYMLNKFPAAITYEKSCKSATLSTNITCPNTYEYAVGQFLRNRNTHVLRNRVSLLGNKLRVMNMRNESKIRLGENQRDILNAWREQHLALSGIKPSHSATQVRNIM
jgi:hypothetical protein